MIQSFYNSITTLQTVTFSFPHHYHRHHHRNLIQLKICVFSCTNGHSHPSLKSEGRSTVVESLLQPARQCGGIWHFSHSEWCWWPPVKLKASHTRSLPSIGPGADPGVQAVIQPVVGCHYFLQSCDYLPSCRESLPLGRHQVILFGDRGTLVRTCQCCYTAFAPSRIWKHDLLIASLTLYPLLHL